MQYTHNMINVTREDLLEQIQQQMSTKRFEHVLRVEQTALQMAAQYNVSLEAVSIAALAHDYAKEWPLEPMTQAAFRYWAYPDLIGQDSNILHGFAAADVLSKQFACANQAILTAVAGHTIGWFEMDLVAKIVYMADYIEPERRFPGVETARALAATDLDAAVWYKMSQTLTHLIAKRQPLFSGAVAIYNQWCQHQ